MRNHSYCRPEHDSQPVRFPSQHQKEARWQLCPLLLIPKRKGLLLAQAKLAELEELGDAHAAYKILSACLGSCKMLYAMRTTRPKWASLVLQDFDAAVLETLEATFGSAIDDVS